MGISAAQHQAFARLLQQETAAIQSLLQALQREHQALGARDNAETALAVSDKEQRLRDLEQLAQQRSQLLQQADLTADKAGFDAFLASDSTGQLAEHWARLGEMLRECMRQNQINGALLESGKQISQQMLSILTGRDFAQDELYNQKGKTASSLGQNTSFKA
jgi:flagella synthesis protein FlgN